MPIRVLIADDDQAMRDTLAELVADDEGLELVGAARDADEAIAMAATGEPHVALLDVRMPAGGGPRASREILRSHPETAVIAFTAYEERGSAVQMIRAGATSYVLKGSRATEVLEAIHLAAQGHGVLPAEVIPSVLGELAARIEHVTQAETEKELRTARIRHEIDSDTAQVVFQPIVDLRSGDLIGLEALTRFSGTPYRTPDVWFAEAADVGLGEELELAAARRAIRAARDLPAGPYVALNLSPSTFVSERTQALLAEAPGDVVIEITEHAPIANYDQLDAVRRSLRDRGGRLAVDDAGAGFASLRHILRLSPDIIKLDISLTRDVHLDPRRRALAAAMITFAEELGAIIVAEGIENELELTALRSLGVPDGQGYFLGRPAAPTEIRPPAGGTWVQPAAAAVTLGASEPEPAPAATPSAGLRDELTGMWGREAFLALSRQILAVAARMRGAVGLLLIDLDGTQMINDALGRGLGDRALSDLAGVLNSTFQESDLVARIGGDEFCVLTVGDVETNGRSPGGQLAGAIEQFNLTAGRSYQLAVSAGTTLARAQDGPSIEELLDLAGRAMNESRRSQHSKPHLLVVEDDPGSQYLAQMIFTDTFEVAFASNGTDALNLAMSSRPDVILLDLNLPDISGTEVASALRSSPETAKIPILMVTGADQSREVESLRAGVDDYVTKPYDIAVLRLRVENALRRSARR
jgi:diguanylate cyclase (GGDEF)-like protein